MEEKFNFYGMEWNRAEEPPAHNPANQQRREANHQSNQMLAFLLAPHLMDLVDSAKREEKRRQTQFPHFIKSTFLLALAGERKV